MSRVLVVDDEPENVETLRAYFSTMQEDWEIQAALGEAEAQRAIDEWAPDVVITDLVMETEESGMRVLRAARTRDPLAMVIIVTAHDDKLNRYQAFREGAFDSVPKNMPGLLAAEELLIKARSALEFRRVTLEQIAARTRIETLGRFFDARLLDVIEGTPSVLDLHPATVTICFWDIRGFSRFSESLKTHPELISGFLREYFDLASGAIFEHGGVLDKFIGDGVMALFGVVNPADQEGREDAAQALNAASALANRFDALVENWKGRWEMVTPEEITIGLGCGINTGEVLVGNIGGSQRHQFSALGTPVNFAQRLEARANAGQILVSNSTWARLKDRFVFRNAGVMDDIKNIPGTFHVHELVYPTVGG